MVSEIVLDGNPICENINETSYVKMVKSFCPDVKKIVCRRREVESFIQTL